MNVYPFIEAEKRSGRRTVARACQRAGHRRGALARGDLDHARLAAEFAADHPAACEARDCGALAVWLRRTGSSRVADGDLAQPDQVEIEGEWEKAAQLWTDLGVHTMPIWPSSARRTRRRCGVP